MDNTKNKEVFAKNLRFYLDRSGKQQKDLAVFLDVSTATVCDWANGNIYPRIDKIEKLAEYFGISKSDLIEDHETSNERMRLSKKELNLIKAYRSVPEWQQVKAIQLLRVILGDIDED